MEYLTEVNKYYMMSFYRKTVYNAWILKSRMDYGKHWSPHLARLALSKLPGMRDYYIKYTGKECQIALITTIKVKIDDIII